jgi:hypothetical protein
LNRRAGAGVGNYRHAMAAGTLIWKEPFLAVNFLDRLRCSGSAFNRRKLARLISRKGWTRAISGWLELQGKTVANVKNILSKN